jgi:hypothetical protein
MIISNLKIYNLIPPEYLRSRVALISEKVFNNEGYLMIKPSGKLVYRRKMAPGLSPDLSCTEAQILQYFTSHMLKLKSNAEQLDKIKSTGSDHYMLAPLFDIKNYSPPLFSIHAQEISGRYMMKESMGYQSGNRSIKYSVDELKDNCWLALLKWEFTDDVKVKSEINGDKKILCSLETSYLLIAFNKSNIINLISTSVPILGSETISDFKIDVSSNKSSELNIKYIRYLPKILLPFIYEGDNSINFDSGYYLDDYINQLIPDSVIPSNFDLKNYRNGFDGNSIVPDEKYMQKRIIVEQIADRKVSNQYFPRYNASINYDLKVVTIGLGAVERFEGLNPFFYNSIWKRGNTSVKFKVADLESLQYEADEPLGRKEPKAEVSFNMNLLKDAGVSIFNAINWMECNYLNRGIAVLKSDECSFPDVDSFYFQSMENLLKTNTIFINTNIFIRRCYNYSITLVCIYWLKIILANRKKYEHIYIVTKSPNNTTSQFYIDCPILMDFIKIYKIGIENQYDSTEMIEFSDDDSIVYLNINILLSHNSYGIERLRDYFYSTLGDLYYGLERPKGIDSINLYSSKVQNLLNESWHVWDPLAVAQSDYSTSEFRRKPDSSELSILNRAVWGVISLNYGVSSYDPIEYLNKVLPTTNYIRKDTHQHFEEILVHEVGHLLAKMHYHNNNFIEYEYENIGLSSYDKDQIFPTEKNVITILNDDANRLRSIKSSLNSLNCNF